MATAARAESLALTIWSSGRKDRQGEVGEEVEASRLDEGVGGERKTERERDGDRRRVEDIGKSRRTLSPFLAATPWRLALQLQRGNTLGALILIPTTDRQHCARDNNNIGRKEEVTRHTV